LTGKSSLQNWLVIAAALLLASCGQGIANNPKPKLTSLTPPSIAAGSPGFVLTEGTKELFDDDRLEQFAASAAAGRVCTPEDIADVVVFLASDAARYVNGQTVVVNGGGVRALTW